MRATTRLFLLILALLAASPAWADNYKDCASTNFDRSIKGCSAIIKAGRETKKNLAIAYYNRGTAYSRKGDDDRAIEDYGKAIALNPKYANAYYNRGLAYAYKGDYDRAIADFDKAIALNLKDAEAYGNRGLAYAYKGDDDRAIGDYDKAIALNPKHANAYYNSGLAYNRKGDYDRAIADFDKAIALNPKYAEAYGNRGLAYNRKGDYDRAIEDYDKAIALNPKYANAYHNRGIAYGSKGLFEKALADFRQALSNYPSTDKWYGEAQKRIAEMEKKIADAANVQTEAQTSEVPPAQPTQPPAIQSIGKRVALVIGNSAYEFSPELRNPRNDASAMSRMLSSMGFEVISGMDLKKPELEGKVREFANAAKTADLSLFFYAGHGLQVAGQNYLVPIDAKVEDDTALNFELVNAAVVTNYMGGEKKVGIVLLDACRDNPFTRSLKRSLGATRAASVGQGLAAISSEGGGLVIGYATAPGDVAADGDGVNSPFTTALLRRLPTKGTELELVLKRVKADVIEATHNEQRPWTNSDLSTEVYLQPPPQEISLTDGILDTPGGGEDTQTPAPKRPEVVEPATPERRIALVIGNASYEFYGKLKNPENDARDIAEVLTKIGFDVISTYNANRITMEDYISNFSREVERADAAVIYYAGHGMQFEGVISIDRRNTLIFVGRMECWDDIQASDIFYR